MRIRTTHTYAILDISPAAYDEIRGKLIEAGYGHTIMKGGEIDCDGIALGREAAPPDPAPKHEEETLP